MGATGKCRAAAPVRGLPVEIALLIFLLAGRSSSLAAQESYSPPTLDVLPDSPYGHVSVLAPYRLSSQNDGSATASLGWGLGLGAAGILLGGAIGLGVADCPAEEECELQGAFYGAAAGETLGMALGIHIGNRRRGSFALDIVTATLISGTGIGVAYASDWDNEVTLLALVAVPIAQLIGVTLLERAVGRKRAEVGNISFHVMAGRRDSVAVIMSFAR